MNTPLPRMRVPAPMTPTGPSLGYRLHEPLGICGEGTELWRAVRADDGVPLLLKRALAGATGAARRIVLQREFELIERLRPAGVPRALQQVADDDALDCLFADAPGVLLSQLLQRPIPVELALQVGIDLLAPLAVLHREQLCHHDLRPSNVLVDANGGGAWLIDLSQVGAGAPAGEAAAPRGPGEADAYRAPEQTGRMNRPVDHRSDLYALGVMLYRMLGGCFPFEASDALEWAHAHVARVPISLAERVAALPGPLVAIVSRLLAKAAEDRYQSADGLRHDLQRCLAARQSTGAIAPFELGACDVSDRFALPARLYGREPQIDLLQQAWDSVATLGTPQLVLVTGAAGSGRTALAEVLREPATAAGAYFARIRFGEAHAGYGDTVAQAAGDLVRQVLVEDPSRLEACRHALRGALGDGASVLVELVPSLERLLGRPAPGPDLQARAALARLHTLVRTFLGVFARAGAPLVLLLDEVQSADPTSLQLIEQLLCDPSGADLLLVATCREDALGVDHPLRAALAEIERTRHVVRVAAGPLPMDALVALLADTLRCERAEVGALARIVHAKTHGNPSFVGEVLCALHRDGLIGFDPTAARWRWDEAGARAVEVTANVVELMLARIVRLAEPTQAALKCAACIGERFDAELLAAVLQQPLPETTSRLHAAEREGLLRLDAVASPAPAAGDAAAGRPRWRWGHVRFREAALALVTPAELPPLHLAIGRQLRMRVAAGADGQVLLDAATHLNRVAALQSAAERAELLELNRRAGAQARAANAHAAAGTYFTAACALLGDDARHAEAAPVFELHFERARCAWLAGEIDAAAAQMPALLDHARSTADRVAAHELYVEVQSALGAPEPAVRATLVLCAELFDLRFDLHPSRDELVARVERVLAELGERSVESLAALPLLADAAVQHAMALISRTLPAAYFTDPYLHDLMCTELVNLSLRHGNGPHSPHGYASFGRTLGMLRRGPLATRFGRVACAVVEMHGFAAGRASTYYLVGTLCGWTQPVRESVPLLQHAQRIAAEYGDVSHTCYAGLVLLHNRFAAGDPLDAVLSEAEHQLKRARAAKFHGLGDAIEAIRDLALCMLGRHGAAVEGCLDGANLGERVRRAGNARSAEVFHTCVALARYLAGDHAAAASAALEARPFVREASGALVDGWHFYAGLAVGAHVEATSGAERAALVGLLAGCVAHCAAHRAHSPVNFGARAALLEAELARIEGRELAAMRGYEEAIASAREGGFVHVEAFANEAAGRFHAARRLEGAAAAYLVAARDAYARWGAHSKVRQLEANYPHLANDRGAAPGIGGASLDLLALIKATQALSGEIVLDRLLGSLLTSALASAGAERACLILEREHGPQPVAWAKVEFRGINLALGEQLPPAASIVPMAMVQAVREQRRTFIHDDAGAEQAFADDPYLRTRRVRSMLCLPVHRQAALIGVLYLENALVAGAFHAERVRVLEVLAAQAAISLDNAELYSSLQRENEARRRSERELTLYRDHLEQLVAERTAELTATNQALSRSNAELRQAQSQLLQSEKLASIGQLAAGVAHEINNPIGFVMSNMASIESYMRDLLRVIDCYDRCVEAGAGTTEQLALLDAARRAADLDYIRADAASVLSESNDGLRRVKKIVQDLRDYSRAGDVELAVVDIHAGLDSTLNIVANEIKYKAAVVKNYGAVPAIECAPHELNQVFLNILVNAGQAIDGRGTITLGTGADAAEAWITIADTGCGIAPEHLGRIFDPFFTTKPVGTGTGLGLSISYSIVHKHGGRIEVESTRGVGTTFRIVLPLRQRRTDAPPR